MFEVSVVMVCDFKGGYLDEFVDLILGTARLEGSRLFWSMIVRIQAESHSVTCWKFCYIFHRLVRDGHQNVVSDSVILSPYFSQLSKYWVS